MRSPSPLPATPEQRGYSPRPEFVALDRNPSLPSPDRWEPTVKRPGEAIVTARGLVIVGGAA